MPRYGKRRYSASQRYRRRRRYGRRKLVGFRPKKSTNVAKSSFSHSLASRPRRVYAARRKWLGSARLKRAVSGMPCAKYVKLTYSVWLTPLYAAADDSFVINFRGNGPYDPEYAIGGGQPRWYDQYAEDYRNLYCHGSSIYITHSTTTPAGEAGPYRWGVHAASASEIAAAEWITSSVSNSTTDLAQRRFTKSKLADIQVGLPYSATGKQRHFHIKSFATTKQVNGYNFDRYNSICSVGATPDTTQEWLWQVFFKTVFAQELTTAIRVRVQITYYCTFFERKVQFDA